MSKLPAECEQLLISGYVLGNLSPAEALLFEEILAENPDLVEQVTLMQQTLDSVYNPPEVSPPATLRDRILQTANTQQANFKTAGSTANNPQVASSSQSSVLGKILGALALLIITVLGIANYRLWRTVKTANLISQTEQKTYLLQSENLSETTAKLTVNLNQLSGNLMVDNLPPLPPEKVYALWTVVGENMPYTTDQKGAILTAVFQVDEFGKFAHEIAVPQPHLEPRTIKKIAITVEDKSAPQAHEGSIVISTQDQL
ncbi:MAG: anti-sigma factor [Cyanobacteria bacterium P01_G01_bin.39]